MDRVRDDIATSEEMTVLAEKMPRVPIDWKDAIAEADPAILLASLVSITGDTGRIAEFAPQIENTVVNYRVTSRMPAEYRAALDAWAMEVLDVGTARPAPAELDDTTFATLATTLVGIPVRPETVPFLREQAGFSSFDHQVPAAADAAATMKVIVVGGGMAGVAMAVAARKVGFAVQVLEKNDGIGGVWWRNRYPGVGVDTPSKYYSLSFDINRDWTNSYPAGDEFREYLDRVAREQGIIDDFTFGAEVTDMVWDETTATWTVGYCKDGLRHETVGNAVVTAAGYLSRPVLPDVPGLESFAGHWTHSADWDDSYDYTGKRVAVIGTGCTSVQIVDALAPNIKSLTLFQRQPHWVTPSVGGVTIPVAERWLIKHVPTYAEWTRLHTFLVIGDANYEMVRYDAEWAAQHDISISELNETGMQLALQYLQQTFADRPDLLKKLTPTFAFMGKRPVRDPGHYYETLKRDSTEVVASSLTAVTPAGPVDADGVVHEADAIIYATGFALDFLSSIRIQGRDGRLLADVWKDRPHAYLGTQIPGFPNLFVTSGPNANPSHGGSHNFCVEAVVHYIVECLLLLVNDGARSMEPTTAADDRWDNEIREALKNSVWAREKRANTYYRNASGDVVLASPLRMEDYWRRLRHPVRDDLLVR